MANTFNPAEWLASFKAADGAYVMDGERLHLWYMSPKTGPDDLSKVRSMAADLAPDERAQIIEHLRSGRTGGGLTMALPFTRKRSARLAGILAKLEPWYDWGTINTVNMDARTDAEQAEGDVYRFEIQWLGLHLGIQIGRTPKRRA